MLCRMLLSVFPIPERQQYEGLAQSRRRLGSNVQDVDSSVQQAVSCCTKIKSQRFLNSENSLWRLVVTKKGLPPSQVRLRITAILTQKSALEADWDLNETRSTCIGISAPGIQGKPPLELLESSIDIPQ